jgi:DNA-binding response OmpR family regulator
MTKGCDVARIFVIEDDESIGAGLLRTLNAEGHNVEWATSAASARELPGEPAVVLLDLGLPDADGLELCRELLGRHPAARVIMLTARSGEMDTVLGLNAGAVDYVAKPFRLAELLARVQAQLRIVAPPSGALSTTEQRVADIRIDLAARRVWVGEQEIELRSKEFDLLTRLAREPGAVVKREDLINDVWDEHWWGSTKTLDTHMASLRRRLGERSPSRSRITTIRGVGYRLDA